MGNIIINLFMIPLWYIEDTLFSCSNPEKYFQNQQL